MIRDLEEALIEQARHWAYVHSKPSGQTEIRLAKRALLEAVDNLESRIGVYRPADPGKESPDN